MMFYLESGAYLCHHVIIQVETIVGYDSLWKSILTYDFFRDEPATTDFVTLAYDAVFTYLVK